MKIMIAMEALAADLLEIISWRTMKLPRDTEAMSESTKRHQCQGVAARLSVEAGLKLWRSRKERSSVLWSLFKTEEAR
jgi:hypothetical protein